MLPLYKRSIHIVASLVVKGAYLPSSASVPLGTIPREQPTLNYLMSLIRGFIFLDELNLSIPIHINSRFYIPIDINRIYIYISYHIYTC